MALAALALLSVVALVAGDQVRSPGRASVGSSAASEAYGKLPLSFIPNRGQTDSRVRYYAQAPGFTAYFTEDRAAITLTKGREGTALHLRFPGSSPNARLVARERAPGKVNYISASESHTDIPTYEALTYRGLWPGIDMTFRAGGGKLRYEFLVRPGADPSDIRLTYAGADGLSIAGDGALRIHTAAGSLVDAKPRSYQPIGGRRVPVASAYALRGKRSYGFTLAAHDARRLLVIDPDLGYSTFLGGSATDEAFGIGVDAQGSAYVAGRTGSVDFPTTPGAFRAAPPGDAFVTKLSKDGSSLAYSTFLDGSGYEEARGVAVDDQGHAFVTGFTLSSDFPTTPGAYDTSYNGSYDVFLSKLNANGSGLLYSTYLGGPSVEGPAVVAVDRDGGAYLTGNTDSSSFPTTPNAFQTTNHGGNDVFVARFDPTGSALVYSTQLGTSDPSEFAYGLAVDEGGDAYVTGRTSSASFPTTAGAFDRTASDTNEAFVSKFSPDGSSLLASTYLGGTGYDVGTGLAVGSDQNPYVLGDSDAPDFPTTANAYDTTPNGGADVFVTKLDPALSRTSYSTFLGGSAGDFGGGTFGGHSIEVDASGRAYVSGTTGSLDFPVTAGRYGTPGGLSVFVTRFDPSGSEITYSALLGGNTLETSGGIALDVQRNVYATGMTDSSNFPTTPGAFDTTHSGTSDAFVTRLDLAPGPPATLVLSPKTATNTVDQGGHCVTATVADASEESTPGVTVRFTVTGATSASGTETTDANGVARFCYQGPEFPGTDAITARVEPSGPSDTATKTWVAPSSTDGCRVTGAGRIRAENGDTATFSQNVHAVGSGQARGKAQYTDHGPVDPLKVVSKAIDALVCDGSRATIFGRATVGGTSVSYRIELDDRGQGRRDTYRILLSTGYDSGTQTLTGGNLQVR